MRVLSNESATTADVRGYIDDIIELSEFIDGRLEDNAGSEKLVVKRRVDDLKTARYRKVKGFLIVQLGHMTILFDRPTETEACRNEYSPEEFVMTVSA